MPVLLKCSIAAALTVGLLTAKLTAQKLTTRCDPPSGAPSYDTVRARILAIAEHSESAPKPVASRIPEA